jgi:hypothetical protein
VILIASVAGLMGVYGYGPYCATKHALVGLAGTMRAELAGTGVHVHVVCPPEFESPMVATLEGYRSPENRAIVRSLGVLPVEAVVKETLRGVEGGRFLIVPGREARAAVTAARLFPAVARWMTDRMLARPAPGAERRFFTQRPAHRDRPGGVTHEASPAAHALRREEAATKRRSTMKFRFDSGGGAALGLSILVLGACSGAADCEVDRSCTHEVSAAPSGGDDASADGSRGAGGSSGGGGASPAAGGAPLDAGSMPDRDDGVGGSTPDPQVRWNRRELSAHADHALRGPSRRPERLRRPGGLAEQLDPRAREPVRLHDVLDRRAGLRTRRDRGRRKSPREERSV